MAVPWGYWGDGDGAGGEGACLPVQPIAGIPWAGPGWVAGGAVLPGRGGRRSGVALAGVLHQERAEVQARQVAVPGGWFHDPERAGDFDVVAGVAGSAVVVDVFGVPDRAGVLEHEVAVGVVEAGTTGGGDGQGEGAVAVVDDRVVVAIDGEDVGEGAAGLQIGHHQGAVRALPVK